MRIVACSGFPVPVSRYWKEFPAVELTETELRIPGAGTVRRWIRESPDGFTFSFLAPGAFADAGFALDGEAASLIEQVGALADTLQAKAIVFKAPESFKANRLTRSALRRFLQALPEQWPVPVIDLPEWSLEHRLEAAADSRAVVAYDPLKEIRPKGSHSLSYLTLPGPAGHRSRYDDAAVEKVIEHCLALKEDFVCAFRNIDMHANASTVWKRLKSGKAAAK